VVRSAVSDVSSKKMTFFHLPVLRAAAGVTLCLLFCPQAPADSDVESQRNAIAAMYHQQDAVRSITSVALSPDGSHLAWNVSGPNPGTEDVYIAPATDPSAAVRIAVSRGNESPCRNHEPVWSPDSHGLAFLSDCQSPGQSQVFVINPNGGQPEPQPLTHLKGFLSHPQWSPGGESVAFLFVPSATRTPSPMAAEGRAVGVIDDLQNTDVQRLSVADVKTAVTRDLTPDNLYVFEYDWSPDGHKVAFTAAPPPGDDNWYIAQLYTASTTGAGPPTAIYKPALQMALPRWSPDGNSIAFIQGLMSDQGGTGGEICIVPSNGGPMLDLTPQRKSSPAWYTWMSSSEILFTEFTGGSTAIGSLDVLSKKTSRLWEAPETVHAGSAESSLSVARTGPSLQAALIRTSWSMLPEVWTGPVGQWRQVTHINTAVRLPLPKFENVTWASGRFQVQGWLLYPRDYNPTKRYPMLVSVHGGPAWIATPAWRMPDFDTTLFTEFGYFVFFPNARGSYGQGESFTQANRRDWGFGDLQDMLKGADTVVAHYPVDNNRIGILGWSYGGSTAMMAVTQTHRFRAAVAGAGAGDWQSYYGQNAIDKWMVPYFGASVYDDPKAYRRCSALTYIKNASTPTLVLVGERDGEAPPAQSIQFWHALKELRVPTKLVIYADEGHSFYKQEDRIDVTLRTLQWFDNYMHAN
jgi:dipeptidyl aminopeptidase/acylaminoacyl peptidase